ncbi:hypothetical protein WS67_21770 [Burkholderia singularis]|uniref:Lipoprotein n=2 Tax=Burkholderia singularis TaxID=1503053 RepID=A0A103DW63_9BURK|nr:hypothetical protein AQ611_21830 [Burkholderia sp. Bp7605]KVE23848.1 hypothetical protein WS67_21770 [Burkholderia singularis]
MTMKITWTTLTFAALAAAGCTASSWPTYSVTQTRLPDHPDAYRVSCGGLFGKSAICTNVAARVCGDRQVNTIAADAAYRDNGQHDEPLSLTFECVSTPLASSAPGS